MAVTGAVVVVGSITVAEVATAVAVVGMVTSVVGMVTHNKTLTQVGAVMSLAGGIASAGFSGAFAGADAVATADATSASTASDMAGMNTPNPNIQWNADFNPAPVNPSEGLINGATAQLNPNVVAPYSGSGINPSDPSSIGLNANNPLPTGLNPQLYSPPNIPPTSEPSVFNPTPSGTQTATSATTVPTASTSTNPSASVLDQAVKTTGGNTNALLKWFSDLPATAKASVVQGIGGALGGLSGAYSENQKLSLAQLQNSQEWQKYQTSYTNLNSPSKITFNPAPKVANGGLINSATKPAV